MPDENTKEKVEVSEVDMNLEIIMRDVDVIIPYDKNPRDNDNSVDNVIESIKNSIEKELTGQFSRQDIDKAIDKIQEVFTIVAQERLSNLRQ